MGRTVHGCREGGTVAAGHFVALWRSVLLGDAKGTILGVSEGIYNTKYYEVEGETNRLTLFLCFIKC